MAHPLTWKVQGLPRGREAHATLSHIKRAARGDAWRPEIRLLAQELTDDFLPYDIESEARALHRFVRDEIRYTRDVYGLETVQTPRLTLELGSGDCDDKTALLAALLLSTGHPVRYVLARASPREPGTFTHVYLETPVRGRWTALETIIPGRPMGWRPRQYGAAHRELEGAVYVSARDAGIAGTELSGFWRKIRKWRPGRAIKKWKPGKTLVKVAPFAAGAAALAFGGPAVAAAALKAGRKAVTAARTAERYYSGSGGGRIIQAFAKPAAVDYSTLVSSEAGGEPVAPPGTRAGMPGWALPALLAVGALALGRRKGR